MKLADTDWKCSVWTGLALLGAATFIIFGLRPGGFEGQIGWYLGLLPGVLVDIFFPHPFLKSSPHIAGFVFWALALGFTLSEGIVAHTTEVKSSHIMYISHPGDVAKAIEEAANTTVVAKQP